MYTESVADLVIFKGLKTMIKQALFRSCTSTYQLSAKEIQQKQMQPPVSATAELHIYVNS